MKRLFFNSILITIISLLCMGFRPGYYPVIHAEGNYNLNGKKYYIAEIQYDSLGTDISESRLEVFGNYVRQSLLLRGAVEVEDRQEADFLVNASVHFWGEEGESAGLSAPKRNVGGKGARADAWKSFRDTIGVDWPERDKRYQDKGISKRTYHQNYFHKMIEIAAFDNDEKPLFKSSVSSNNRSLGFRALNNNEVMLFVLADSYGNTARQKFNLDAYDDYLAKFKKGELANDSNVTFAPECTSSSKGVGIFLIDRLPDKTVVVVKDEGKLKLDDGKNKTAMLRIGETLLPCSSMTYSFPKGVKGVRLLTLEFPSIGDDDVFDLLFCKKNKEKHTLNVNLDRKEFKQIKVKNRDSHYNYYSDDVRQEQRWLRLKEKGRGWSPDMNKKNVPVSPTLYPDYSAKSIK